MKQEQKAQIIEAIAEDLANYPNVYVTDISGFTVEMVNQLRRQCFKREIKLKVVKNTLLKKAMELQASSIGINRHSGIYYELKVGKYTQKENWEKKYKERINFWTKRMLEDPTDFISASYRIRSYMDIGDFDNAEQLCACLPTDVKAPLMEEIKKATGMESEVEG